MPNGKGTIDCCYCKHFGGPAGYPAGHGEAAGCQFHGTELPVPDPKYLNRICCHFEPNEWYFRHNPIEFPPARRFAWFARDLMPGVLYFFSYNTPENITYEVTLREPDYESGGWKPVKPSNDAQ